MKATNRYLSAVIALAAVAMMVFLALDLPPTAFSTTALSAPVGPAGSPTPPAGEAIPLRPIMDLTSLNATLKLDVNGRIDGKRTQRHLTGLLSNNHKKSRLTVSGGLLRELAAKLGGPLVGLLTPSKLDIYTVPDGAYIFVDGLFPLCVKPKALNATASLEGLSPQGLLTLLTSSDVARGELVGEETLNGVPVKHYVIDGDAFLAAARKSKPRRLRAFAEGLWSAEDADVYVDARSGYPVAFRGNYSGAYAPIEFEGDFSVQIELTGVNTNPAVDLPSSCNKPIGSVFLRGTN